jgi:transcriptional regulator with XRE-family HTH domain
VTVPSPTVRQRELGVRLRELRNALGLTVEEVAERLLCSAAKISRAETGTRRASLRDVRDLCQLYGVGVAETAELMDLARMAREPGWWTQYSDLKLEPYIGLEQEATAITSFSMYCLPGLVQTEHYARTVIRSITPKMNPKVLDERVEARLRRQQLLDHDNPPRFRILLDEAVLRRQVGSREVMAEQLGKILTLERRSKLTVQVIALDVGAYNAFDIMFTLLEFGDSMSPVVFLEGLVRNQYLERSGELDRYRESVESLRDEALNPRDSVECIRRYQESFAG